MSAVVADRVAVRRVPTEATANMPSQPTYFTVTIDTEEEWDWNGGWPITNPSTTNIRALPRFQALCDRYGVRPTYFTNLAVFENAESKATLLDIAAATGVEIGMHIHPWNTPPIEAGVTPTARSTFLHNLPDKIVQEKLDSVYNAFLEAGIRPTSFRGGRYSSGGVIHDFLQDRGFVADYSVVPFTNWPDEGAPDYRHRDLTPRRIAPRRPHQTPLWELPLSLGYSRTPFRFWQRCFALAEGTPLRKLRLIGLAEKLGIVRRVWLNFEIADPHDWTPFVQLLQRLNVPCLCFTVHSSSLAAGPGPYTKTQADEDRIFGQIEQIFATLARLPGFVPATASEVAQQLEQRYASSGN